MNTKRLTPALCGLLLAGYLTGCGPSMEARDSGAALAAYFSEVSSVSLAAVSEDDGRNQEVLCGERFQPYELFGLLYDAEKNELRFNGELVRWFEDYYPLSENGEQAGTDFFNKDGTVDVYAVRDRSRLVRFADGSYDPSGILTGVEAFSEEAFAARDIKALQNPVQITASTSGAELSEEELNAIAGEYAPFGVTYDFEKDQWYWNGEAVRYLRDVLTSNGENLTGGGFQGVIRTLSSRGGTISIETIRDFVHPNSLGYGTLTGVQAIKGP